MCILIAFLGAKSLVFFILVNAGYLDIFSCRCAVEQCRSHSAMESNVLLSAKQRYLPSGVRFGPKLALLVRLNGCDKNSPPTYLQQNPNNRRTFVAPKRNINLDPDLRIWFLEINGSLISTKNQSVP
jgi:hypothetical protein